MKNAEKAEALNSKPAGLSKAAYSPVTDGRSAKNFANRPF